MERFSRKKIVYAGQECSFQRVLKIQQCLCEGKFNADCVLIILGVDSRFSNGNRNALEKILPGFESAASSRFPSDDVSEEAMDDLVICIKKNKTEIYCNPLNYDSIMFYAACWNNLTVHCLDKLQYENHEDLAEELKIISFVKMVEDCPVVAVPYNYSDAFMDQGASFDPMAVEKWPLIQAYALEDIGRGGFFTMMHEVIDASELLNEALCSFDPLGLELLLTKQLSQFEKQWKTLIGTIDVTGPENLEFLKEEVVAEPLTTYYHHATGEHNAATASKPSVKFGISTSKGLNEVENKTLLGRSGLEESYAYHMVCQGRDAKGLLSCKRTFFFEPFNGESFPLRFSSSQYHLLKMPVDVAMGSARQHIVPDLDAVAEVRLLEKFYMMAADAMNLIINTYCRFPESKCREMVTKTIIEDATDDGCSFIPDESDIEVTVTSRDQLGRINCSENGTVKLIEVAIHNIPSIKVKGKSLGSVAFSETIFTSSIHFNDNLSSSYEGVILTYGVPRYASWPRERSIPVVTEVSENQDGDDLVLDASCELISGVWPVFDIKEVAFEGFDKAIKIHHAQFGDVTIPLQSVKAWETFDNDSISSPTLIIIHPNANLLKELPFWMAKDGRVVLSFQPRSKAHSAFYDRAFHVWKEIKPNHQPLQTINALPEELAKIYKVIQENLKVLDEKENGLARLFRVFPNLKRFFKHFELSSSACLNINRKNLQAIMSDGFWYPESREPALDDSELLVTILTGLPGSDSDNLCKALTSLARESSRWITAKVPSDIKEKFDRRGPTLADIQKFESAEGTPPGLEQEKKTTHFTDTGVSLIYGDVIRAIEEHPDDLIRSKLKIGAVTCCINPSNLFLYGKTLMPFALDQCTSGFVNNAVFTGPVDTEKGGLLPTAQRLIRQCNQDISFIIARHGEVTRTPDVETMLSDTAFSRLEALRARAIFNSNKSTLDKPVVQQMTIPFFQPLDRSRFLSSLKELKASLSIENSFNDIGILYMEGKVGFSDHTDVREFRWCKTSGTLSLTTVTKTLSPRPPSSKTESEKDCDTSKYGVTFFGLGIQEENLKQLIQNWRRQEKPLMSRKDIPNNKLKEIENLHKFDPLPAGWFYNGSQYVSFEGDRNFKHPSFSKFVDDYIAAINEDLQQYNKEINHLDMFKQAS